MVDLTGLEFWLGALFGWSCAGAVILAACFKHGWGLYQCSYKEMEKTNE